MKKLVFLSKRKKECKQGISKKGRRARIVGKNKQGKQGRIEERQARRQPKSRTIRWPDRQESDKEVVTHDSTEIENLTSTFSCSWLSILSFKLSISSLCALFESSSSAILCFN